MNIKACIFDLDGTLADTVEDIADNCNIILKANNYPERKLEEYTKFIGNGSIRLLEQALPDNVKEDRAEVTRLLEQFDELYSKNILNKTRLYSNIQEMLDIMEKNNIKMAVLSNKPHKLTVPIIKELVRNKMEIIMGHKEEFARKPDPTSLNWIMDQIGVTPEETVYIGDTNVDIEVSRNAGTMSIGVSWGFWGEEALKKCNPDYIAETPLDICKFINIM